MKQINIINFVHGRLRGTYCTYRWLYLRLKSKGGLKNLHLLQNLQDSIIKRGEFDEKK